MIRDTNKLKLINSLKFLITINPKQIDGKQKIKKYFSNFKSTLSLILKIKSIKIKFPKLEIIDMGNKKNLVSIIE